MKWIIDRKPSILATDTPAWENLHEPGGFFPEFYAADILMLAPLCGVSAVPPAAPELRFCRCGQRGVQQRRAVW